MSNLILAVWITVWFVMSCLIGFGCAALGLNIFVSVFIIVVQAGLFLISSVALAALSDKE